jgi:hypothetical protein
VYLLSWYKSANTDAARLQINLIARNEVTQEEVAYKVHAVQREVPVIH